MSFLKALGTFIAADWIVSTSSANVSRSVEASNKALLEQAQRHHEELMEAMSERHTDVGQPEILNNVALSPRERNLVRSIQLEETDLVTRLNDRVVEPYFCEDEQS